MIVLTIRTDKPEAEVGLYDDTTELVYEVWQAHRALAETLLTKIHETLAKNNTEITAIAGIVCFQGPGSFTGLRIGLTTGNALAYALQKPIVGSMGEDWRSQGIVRLQNGDNDRIVMPEYGAEVHITKPKH